MRRALRMVVMTVVAVGLCVASASFPRLEHLPTLVAGMLLFLVLMDLTRRRT